MKKLVVSSLLAVTAIAIFAASIRTHKPSARQTYDQTIHSQRFSNSTTPPPLIDHGGPVEVSSNTFAIYWGSTSAFPSDLQSSMASLFQGFNRSSYLGTAQQYMRGSGISSNYIGDLIDTSSPPSKAPRTSDIGAEVCKLISNPDPNTTYFVFTSNAPHINYCAWHDRYTCNGVTFQVAYVPNQALLPGCSPHVKSNLHCNALSDGAVASADSVAHEFMESITDPHLDAWYDKSGYEIADKCNFNYQTCVSLKNGTLWQIQSEWSNAISGCQQQ